MDDRLSDLEKKRLKMEELKRRKKELHRKKEEKANHNLSSPLKHHGLSGSGVGLADSGTFPSPGLQKYHSKDSSDPASSGFKAFAGPTIDINDNLGIIKIQTKEPPIMYDQQTEITLEKLKQWIQMEAETKEPVYDEGGDGVDELGAGGIDGRKKDDDGPVASYLTMEEVQKVMGNPKFEKFLKRSLEKLDKVIENKIPLIEDIMEHECPDLAEDLRQKLGDPIKLNDGVPKADNINTKGFIVSEICPTSLGIVAAYALRDESNEGHKGQIIVWNPEEKDPIYVGYTRTKVNRIYCPEEYGGNVIWGGLSSGQVVKWDIKADEKKTGKPVLASMPTLAGNFLPIYGIFGHEIKLDNYSGYRDTKRIISISNDGKLCVWRENDLAMPDFSINLKFMPEHKQETKATQERDGNDLPLAPMIVKQIGEHVLIGTFDRMWHRFEISEFFKGNENVSESEYYSGHQAAVCALSVLSVKDMPDFPSNDLILSSSFDFGIRIWRAGETSSLHSIEFHEDFVTGASWCSLHPGMFASSDSGGNLAIWNLMEDIDYPIYTIKTDSIFTICWQKDSGNILVGTLGGQIEIYPLKKANLKYNDEQFEEFQESVLNNFT